MNFAVMQAFSRGAPDPFGLVLIKIAQGLVNGVNHRARSNSRPGQLIELTVSLGCSTLLPGESADSLLRRAANPGAVRLVNTETTGDSTSDTTIGANHQRKSGLSQATNAVQLIPINTWVP